MKLSEVVEILEAEVFFDGGRSLDQEVKVAASSDLMSDILARVDTPDILLTGLNNLQIIHTAAVSNIKTVVLARGKTPDPKVIAQAEEEHVALLSTRLSLFEASGRLYSKGMGCPSFRPL
jgi:predicted transcriptional regulator